MFGLSTKEKLYKLILNASKTHAIEYKKDIKKCMSTLEKATEEESKEIINIANKKYYDKVANTVISSIKENSITSFNKITTVLEKPVLCGYDFIVEDIKNNFLAGHLYAICFYAITNKEADPRDDIKLNHMQNDIQNQVFSELEQESSTKNQTKSTGGASKIEMTIMTYTYEDGSEYIGKFEDGLPNGQGTMTYADGSEYVGEWKNGKRNGQGTITYTNGYKYIGKWKDGKQNGQGVANYPDGHKYVGKFRDNIFCGKGTYTFADGEEYIGRFKDDKFISDKLSDHLMFIKIKNLFSFLKFMCNSRK